MCIRDSANDGTAGQSQHSRQVLGLVIRQVDFIALPVGSGHKEARVHAGIIGV